MKKYLFLLVVLWLCPYVSAGSIVQIKNSNVNMGFDAEHGKVLNIYVKNQAGKFIEMCNGARLEIQTDMPGEEVTELRLGKLVHSEFKKQLDQHHFTYEVLGKKDWKVNLIFSIKKEMVTWAASIKNPTEILTGLDVRFVFENLYVNYRRAFNTNKLNPDGYPKLRYRADYIGEFPMTSILDEQKDVGLTLNASFGVMRPLLSIDYDKNKPSRSVVFRNQFIGAGDGIDANVSVDLFGHVGDWRPGMGLIYKHYRPYFTTANKAIRSHEGNFLCAWYFLGFSEKQLNSMVDNMMITNCEIMFYNPYYGLYAPDVDDDTPWTILMLEKERLEQFKNDPIRQTTYNQINDTVSRMRDHGVGSFIYFNYIDGSRNMPGIKDRFGDQIFINSENRMGRGKVGGESLGNDNMYIMHMEPGKPWANYMTDQAEKLLERVPDCDGYFIDMANGYGVYDRNHSDGVTVINGKKAYYDAIGIERIQRHLATSVWEPAGKGTWANGPKFPEISRYCDALIAEIPGWTIPEKDPGVPQVSFMCLDKPFVYMLAQWRKDNDPPNPRDIERHYKYALQYGGFIDSMIPMKGPGKEREKSFASYRPLFEAMAGKRWVFTPRPLKIEEPLYGNIFEYDDGHYTVYLFDRDDSVLNPPVEIHTNVKVTVSVPEASNLIRATYTCVLNPEVVIDLPVKHRKNDVTVDLPEFGSAGMVQFWTR